MSQTEEPPNVAQEEPSALPPQTAERPTPPKAARNLESRTDPFRFARAYRNEYGSDVDGRLSLRYWHQDFWRHSNGRYSVANEDDVRTQLTGFVKWFIDFHCVTNYFGCLVTVTGGLIANVLNALKSQTRVPPTVEQPSWLGPGSAGPFVSMKNGLLDIERLVRDGSAELIEHTPEWFSPFQFPYDFDPAARSSRWDEFLSEVLEGDSERIALFQEWCGYLLTPDTSQHKFLIALGEGANGKSVAFEITTALLGAENVSNLRLEHLGGRFQLAATRCKLANICAEVGEVNSVAEGVLKQCRRSCKTA
jgi:putative DNA primase/helicase